MQRYLHSLFNLICIKKLQCLPDVYLSSYYLGFWTHVKIQPQSLSYLINVNLQVPVAAISSIFLSENSIISRSAKFVAEPT